MACDVKCQREKELELLQGALHHATLKKGVDPEAYETARINYYTLKEGQGWLHKEKERKAIQEIDPIIDSYRSKINAVTVSKAVRDAKTQALKDIESEQVGDEDDVRFMHHLVTKESNKAGVRRRYLDLGGGFDGTGGSGSDWWSIFLDILICFMVLGLVYLLVNKSGKLLTPPSSGTFYYH